LALARRCAAVTAGFGDARHMIDFFARRGKLPATIRSITSGYRAATGWSFNRRTIWYYGANEKDMLKPLPDLLDHGLVVVFVGINPSPMAATTGHRFAAPSNRFWRVTHLAGFTPLLLRRPGLASSAVRMRPDLGDQPTDQAGERTIAR
jgi:hypothetical protein